MAGYRERENEREGMCRNQIGVIERDGKSPSAHTVSGSDGKMYGQQVTMATVKPKGLLPKFS